MIAFRLRLCSRGFSGFSGFSRRSRRARRTRRTRFSRALAQGFFALVASVGVASAQSTTELVDLINAYRAGGHVCEGKRTAPARALVINPVLADRRIVESEQPIVALKARGYLAAYAEVVFVSGPRNSADLMQYIDQKYCRVLSSAEVTEIGLQQEGRTWHIVLARPQLAPDLGDWRQAGMEVLRLTNVARASPRTCGNRRFAAAPPVAWNDRLAAAALAHSQDMAQRADLSHTGSGGTNAGERAARVGYEWNVVGENIASGMGAPKLAVDGWLKSPDHCATLMDNRFVEMAVAYALNPRSDATIYWAQEFGKPR